MSGSQYPFIQPGGKLPHDSRTQNAMIDAARAHEARLRPQSSLQVNRYSPHVIKVKNNSGTDVARFGVLGIGDVQMTHADAEDQFFDQIYMDGEEPAVGTHDSRFVVALEPIPNGEVGKCVASGLIQCQVTINDDAHGWATITDASVAKLSSQPTGYAKILWKAGASGDQWAIVHLGDAPFTMFRAKITASSSSSEDHTFEEVDGDDATVTDGRSGTNARAINGRMGVPPNTLVFMLEAEPGTAGGVPRYYFVIPDGLRTNPKDLVNTGATADDTTWNVEDQGSFTGADFDPTRAALTIEALFFYDRILKIDSSGFVHDVEGEKETFIAGDAEDAPLDGHITLKTITSGGTQGKKALINQPQATDWSRSVTFYPGTGIELSTTSGGSAESSIAYDCDFDNSGRENHKAALSQSVYIRATGGGGSADGQGFESVTDGTNTVNKTDGGIISFNDTSNSGTTLGVNFAVANNDPTATVTGTVDASGLTASDVGSAEVLDIEVSVQAAAPGTIVLDNDNYSGRMLQYSYAVLLGSTSATWADYVENPANPSAIYVGSSESADVTLVSATDIFVYIDQSDGYKLKLDHSNPGASFPDWLRLTITKGARKTSPDVTVT